MQRFLRIPSLRHPLAVALLLPFALIAEPLPEGSYADFLVVPVGPIPLAEFERDDRSQAPPADSDEDSEAAGTDERIPGGGSGVRVKEQDPAEIPPRAVYLRRGKDKYWKIPCFLNAISSPVRVPLDDSEVALLLEDPVSRGSFSPLDSVRLPATGRAILVLLSKPVGEKEWTRPEVTMIPVASDQAARLLLINASHALSCGVVIDRTRKLVLSPRKHTSWQPEAPAGRKPVPLSLAMADRDQRFLPPFFNSYLPLRPAATTVLISYEVTADESFRRAKYVRGTFKPGDFRPALPFPAE